MGEVKSLGPDEWVRLNLEPDENNQVEEFNQ